MQKIFLFILAASPQAKLSIRDISPPRRSALRIVKTELCMDKKWHETEFN